MYRNTGIWGDIRQEFQRGDIITRLIFVNIAVFLFLNLSALIAKVFLNQPDIAAAITRQFMIPADPGKLLTRPWTILTHMFSHLGFFHILFNMLWLFWMGRIFTTFQSQKKILPLYIVGALAGALAFVVMFNLIPYYAQDAGTAAALGASAGVMAIVVATATLVPNYQIHLLLIGAVQLKWVALVAVVLDVLSMSGTNAGGSIAHLGGALFGYLYIRQLQSGTDLLKAPAAWLDSLATLFSGRSGTRMRKVKSATTSKRSPRKQPPTDSQQERLDMILDKISKSGYDGLSKEEKEFLFRFSKEQ